MALTESEKTELKNDILNAIKAESQSVDELVEVSSLDNIKSLPALRGSELVSAPLTLLRKPADDAAATAMRLPRKRIMLRLWRIKLRVWRLMRPVPPIRLLKLQIPPRQRHPRLRNRRRIPPPV